MSYSIFINNQVDISCQHICINQDINFSGLPRLNWRNTNSKLVERGNYRTSATLVQVRLAYADTSEFNLKQRKLTHIQLPQHHFSSIKLILSILFIFNIFLSYLHLDDTLIAIFKKFAIHSNEILVTKKIKTKIKKATKKFVHFVCKQISLENSLSERVHHSFVRNYFEYKNFKEKGKKTPNQFDLA